MAIIMSKSRKTSSTQIVKYKKNGKMSARWYYNNGGKVGDIVDYTQNKSKVYRMLKLNKNGTPLFVAVPKSKSVPAKSTRTTVSVSPVRNKPSSFTPVRQRVMTSANFDKIQAMRYNELRPRQIDEDPSRLNKYVGWYASVKIDGWQGIWDGKDTLYTKSYKKSFNVPKWWLTLLQRSGVPAMAGEIIRKNSKNSAEQAALASKKNTKVWGTPENPLAFFHVFDILDTSIRNIPFRKRIPFIQDAVASACGSEPKCPIKMAPQIEITSGRKVYNMWKKIIREGGEGLVLTAPHSKYGNVKTKKSNERVKLKGRNDDEAVVIGHNLGYRKNPEWLQSLRVQYRNCQMNVGIGLTERERENYARHFPMGSIITFSYRLLSRTGKPLETRLVGRRDKRTLAETHWIHDTLNKN